MFWIDKYWRIQLSILGLPIAMMVFAIAGCANAPFWFLGLMGGLMYGLFFLTGWLLDTSYDD